MVLYGIFIFISLILGGIFGYIITQLKLKSQIGKFEERLLFAASSEEKSKETIDKFSSKIKDLEEEKNALNIQLTRQVSEYENLVRELNREKERFENFEKDFNAKFENLAHKILMDKTSKFTDLNKENLENILKPLSEKIKDFENKVTKTNEDFIKGHASLGKQLEILNEQNIKISEEANNLTKALKGDSKTQGNWGELILEKVLEKSNLVRDREYFVQPAYMDSDGNRQFPDVVVHLPNEKRMIIDSKVSLRAYERYVNEEDHGLKENHLKLHIKALNDHIQQLSAKRYEDLLEGKSPDFVLLFIPIEPALYVAQNAENSFFYSAFNRNILLVSPTTLLSTLRTIDALWSNEKQQQHAKEIAKHAGSLYHKFKILLDDLEVVGNRINSTQKSYDKAMKKLTGNQNLIKDIHQLEEMGISPKDRLDPKWTQKALEQEVDRIEDGK